MVAELAEGWNHNRGQAVFEEKLSILHQHCRDLGRDPKTMRVSVERTCAIFNDDAERAAHIARCWPGVNPDRIKGFLDESLHRHAGADREGAQLLHRARRRAHHPLVPGPRRRRQRHARWPSAS